MVLGVHGKNYYELRTRVYRHYQGAAMKLRAYKGDACDLRHRMMHIEAHCVCIDGKCVLFMAEKNG